MMIFLSNMLAFLAIGIVAVQATNILTSGAVPNSSDYLVLAFASILSSKALRGAYEGFNNSKQ